ncbi:HPP family protein [Sphingobium indicum]|uniref:HPP family protein n=2 Tax=Sphingobium TaxID=165695 RepID=UPI00059C54E6|nr:HPP family protein [Sphingobium indicum]
MAILVGQMVVDTSILLTSLISSAVVIITAPASKASYPARVLTSHLVAALTGLVLRSFLPISPWSVAAAVGFALLIVLVADRLHPPAIANAGIMFSANGSTLELIGLVAVTASILTGAAFLSRHCLLRVPTGKEPLS